jgi:peptide deformylase
MILPIYAYGQAVLRKKATPVEPDFPDLQVFIQDMYETMYRAKGVGLAAPQVGKSIRLFIVDTLQLNKPPDKTWGFKRTFINAQMLDETGEPWYYEEGCPQYPGYSC